MVDIYGLRVLAADHVEGLTLRRSFSLRGSEELGTIGTIVTANAHVALCDHHCRLVA